MVRTAAKGLTPWQRHLLLLMAAVALLLVLCRNDVADIVDIWSRTGAFHHCFMIPPILVWLVWQKRALLARLSPEYAAVGLVPVVFGSLLWLAGAAGTVAILRQAGLVIALQGLVVALLGRPVGRALAFPLGFALFLIPAGSEAEPLLQIVTARIAVALLHLTGTPALLEGVFIETPAGLFRIAEACSGTAFLLAMAAYGALVAALCFQSWRRRVLFMVAAMTAALLTNGVRAFSIMKLADLTSIDNPMVQDHLLFGWLLFAAVLVLLMITASRWFEREREVSSAAALQGIARGERGGGFVVPALLAVLLLPRLWLAITAPVEGAVMPPPVPPAVSGWTVVPGVYRAEWQPHFDGASWIGQWRYRRTGGGETADLAVILYDLQEEGRELVGFGQGAVAPEGEWAVMSGAPALDRGLGQWLRGPSGRMRYVATWYLVGGVMTGSRAEAKLAAVRTRLLGGDPVASAILISAPQSSSANDFLNAAGSAQEMADRARNLR